MVITAFPYMYIPGIQIYGHRNGKRAQQTQIGKLDQFVCFSVIIKSYTHAHIKFLGTYSYL